jgi:hypothetical protein
MENHYAENAAGHNKETPLVFLNFGSRNKLKNVIASHHRQIIS